MNGTVTLSHFLRTYVLNWPRITSCRWSDESNDKRLTHTIEFLRVDIFLSLCKINVKSVERTTNSGCRGEIFMKDEVMAEEI